MRDTRARLDPIQFDRVFREELDEIERRRKVVFGGSRIVVEEIERQRQEQYERESQAKPFVLDRWVAVEGSVVSPTVGIQTGEATYEPRGDPEKGDPAESERAQRRRALRMDLTGLAFSGGGIRSATFALGLLQGLASLDLLKRFDYLSTVSGGGYIGGWLAAWLKREGDVENVTRQLAPNRIDEAQASRLLLQNGVVLDEEPEPVHHLRRFSNYLAPRVGALTIDTWTLLSIYGRNFLINLLVLLPTALTLVLLVRAIVAAYGLPGCDPVVVISSVTLALIALAVSTLVISRELRTMQKTRQRGRVSDALQVTRGPGRIVVNFLPILILMPLTALVRSQFLAANVLIVAEILAVAEIQSWEYGWLIGETKRRDAKTPGARRNNPQTRLWLRGSLYNLLPVAVAFGALYWFPGRFAECNCLGLVLALVGAPVFACGYARWFGRESQGGPVEAVGGDGQDQADVEQLGDVAQAPEARGEDVRRSDVAIGQHRGMSFAEGPADLRQEERPSGIFALGVWVVAPLLIMVTLGCWLLMLQIRKTAGVPLEDVVPETFETRLGHNVYSMLFDRPNPKDFGFLTSHNWFFTQAPHRTTALALWKDGAFFWWPALKCMAFFSWWVGVTHWVVNRNVLNRLFYSNVMPGATFYDRCLVAARLTTAPFMAGAIGGLLFYMLVVLILWRLHGQPYAIATIGPPLGLMVWVVAAASEVGLLGSTQMEDEREWWARVSAMVTITAVTWIAVFGMVLYVPYATAWAGETFLNQVVINTGLIAGWFATAISGALAGRRAQAGRNNRGAMSHRLLLRLAPWVFVVGLLALVSRLAAYLVDARPARGARYDYWAAVSGASGSWIVGSLLVSAVLALILARLVDVNLFSLHALYANRLTRAFLGASRRKDEWAQRWAFPPQSHQRCGAPTGNNGPVRHGNPVSGFDLDDDLPLSELRYGVRSRPGDKAYWGPFPLINTALNLIASEDLAWQDRKSESFTLTPIYCGSRVTGYQRLPVNYQAGNLTLGRAMAISGAAADPNMGTDLSGPLIALMTVFNTRLGWWLENPGRPLWWHESKVDQRHGLVGDWSAESPSYGGLLWLELLGRTDEHGHWVHLSDGGHYENLGLYELVRRRCRFIVVSDAGQDPRFSFEDLANLFRRCRTDLGISIQLDTSPLRPQGDARLSRWHCAIGTIRYDEVDPNTVPGTLVYLKTSLTGDEPPDVLNYALLNPHFPHQTTADQFFDERQFESYRALGYHVAREVFAEAVADLNASDSSRDDTTLQVAFRKTHELFSAVRSRWFPAPPDLEANFPDVAQTFATLHAAFRQDENLRALSCDLYPEIDLDTRPDAVMESPGGPSHEEVRRNDRHRRTAELHAVNQVLQLMEKAFLGVKIEGFPEHPMNRGWMNVFRRCANSKTIRKYWPHLSGGFSQDFVKFCQRELKLSDGEYHAVHWAEKGVEAPTPADLRNLEEEFSREWRHGAAQLGEPLAYFRRRASQLSKLLNRPDGGLQNGTPEKPDPAWVIWGKRTQDNGTIARFAVGVILAWEDSDEEGEHSQAIERAGENTEVPDASDSQAKPTTEVETGGSVTGSQPATWGGTDPKTEARTFEFFVWIRPAYRDLGIGRRCVRAPLNEVQTGLDRLLPGAAIRLQASYPIPGFGAPRDKLQRRLWEFFLFNYDFEPLGTLYDHEMKAVVLTRRVHPSHEHLSITSSHHEGSPS
jgi:hypothetical protein